MNKKTITYVAVLSILLIFFFSSIINAIPISGILGYVITAQKGDAGGIAVKFVCSANAALCEGVQVVTNPSGYVEGKAVGFLSEASPELGQAISAATNPQGFITQEALATAAKKNPDIAQGLGEALTVSQQLQSAGVQETTVKMNTEGKVTEMKETKVTKELDASGMIGIKKEQGSLSVTNLDLSKSKRKDHFNAELGEDSIIVMKDDKGEVKNIITNIEGDAELDKDGLKKLEGKTTDVTAFNIQFGDQAYKVISEGGQKMNFDREKKTFTYEGTAPLKWQKLDEDKKPIGDVVEFTPTVEGEGVKLSRNEENGQTQLTGSAKIKVGNREVEVDDWERDGKHYVAAEMIEQGGVVTGCEIRKYTTNLEYKGRTIRGKGGEAWWGPPPEGKESLTSMTVTDEYGYLMSIYGNEEPMAIVEDGYYMQAENNKIATGIKDGKRTTTIGSQDPVPRTMKAWEKRKDGRYEGTFETMAYDRWNEIYGTEPTTKQLRDYTTKILEENGYTWDTADKVKKNQVINLPPPGEENVKIVTPHKSVDMKNGRMSMSSTAEAEEEARGGYLLELKQQGVEELKLDKAEMKRECFPGPEGYSYCFDLPESVPIVETVTYEGYDWSESETKTYNLFTNTQGNNWVCCGGSSEFLAGVPEVWSPEAMVVGMDRITGREITNLGPECLTHYRNLENYLGTPDMPWASQKQIDTWIDETDEGYEALRDQRRRVLSKEPVEVKGIGRVTDYEFLRDERGDFCEFTDKTGRIYRVDYEGDVAGGSVYQIDPKTSKSLGFVADDKKVLDNFRYREGTAKKDMYVRHAPTGTARGIYQKLLFMQAQKEKLGEKVTTVSY